METLVSKDNKTIVYEMAERLARQSHSRIEARTSIRSHGHSHLSVCIHATVAPIRFLAVAMHHLQVPRERAKSLSLYYFNAIL